MAIDYTGITSIDAGAPDIKYTGDEGPRSPEENREIASAILGDEMGEVASQLWNGMSPPEKSEWRSIEGFIQSEDFKIILMQLQSNQQEGRGGIQMASAADPMLQEEYDKYVFEMQEMGQEPMSLEEFRQQAVAGMATGGRAGYKNGYSVQGGVKNYLGDQEMVHAPIRAQSKPSAPPTELAYITDAEKDLLVKANIHGSMNGKPNPGPSGLASLDDVYVSPSGKVAVSTGAQESAREQVERTGRAPKEGSVAQKDIAAARGQKAYQKQLPSGYAVEFGSDGRPTGKVITPDNKVVKPDDTEIKKAKEKEEKKPSVIKTLWDKVFKQKTANVQKYIAYLKSQGATIPDWLAAFDEEDAPKYLTEEQEQLLNYGWKPEEDVADPFLQENLGITPHAVGPMDYKGFRASGWGSESGIGNFGLLSRGDLGNLKDLPNPGTVINPKTGLPFTDFEWDQHKRASGQGTASYGGGPRAEGIASTLPLWQQQGFNSYDDWLAAQGTTGKSSIATGPITGQLGGIDPAHQAILKNIYGGTLPTMFAADGGRAGYAGGGIADLRQGYFLGKIVKAVTKPFKGITRGIKKIAKSPAGKIAMLAFLGNQAGLFGSQTGGSWLSNLIGSKPYLSTTAAMKGAAPSGGSTGWLGKLLLKGGADKWSMANLSPWKSIAGLSALGALTADEDNDEDEMYKKWLADKKAADQYWIPRFDPSNFRRITSADGGRIGYAGGGYNDDEEEDHRSAALRHMYGLRKGAQEGGLMDLGGMEKDYRNEGGFVPIGGQERADDVPARLSKNEFVFTADAVRAAGGGDIDRGAEVMENVMENLENGGKVSEESQGLEGARDMFATAQRLEGVL